MRLYNTLTRKIEEIKPINPPKVTVYTCGPTVYDYPHIGNWFTFIRYDVLGRALMVAGLEPTWVMNITDVGHLVSDGDEGEDKLEKGARREGKTAWDIAKFYGDYFEKSLVRVSMLRPDHLPKATEEIAEQIALLKKLEEKGYTYKTRDGIYFDTSKLHDYGKLARLDIEHLKAGARVEVNPEKRNSTDFALWKFSPADQKRDMEWDSPWGKGFPGWHLECSAMAIKYLGETIDIHGGGIDHIPVHHTNEIAQSEAATGKPFAHYWFHSNFILVDDKKMSKSAGTFITLEDIEAKGFDLMAFRLLVLESHYRTEAHFSWKALEATSNRLKKLQDLSDYRFQFNGAADLHGEEFYESYTKRFRQAVTDDLNTPVALRIVSEFMDEIERSGLHQNETIAFEQFVLDEVDFVFGLDLDSREGLASEQLSLLGERASVRDHKNWKKSDELRDQLKKQGIDIQDTPRGQVWTRI